MVANERGPGTAAIFFSHQFHMVVVYRLERRGGGGEEGYSRYTGGDLWYALWFQTKLYDFP